jgi:prolyl-tRNA editing enzyme YbaK/EbsC (Cys-tRNA(Pro) deacylase)
MSDVLAAVRGLLDGAGIAYTVKTHEPTHTSEESARARGEPLEIGAKALVIKADGAYRLFVLPAHQKVDSGAIKRHLGAKKLRFADAAELLELTGLVPGSIPPFGEPVLPLPLVADPALLANARIAFNAGSLTTSIIMASADYERVSGAEWIRFASEG